jgi:hypothetical protein
MFRDYFRIFGSDSVGVNYSHIRLRSAIPGDFVAIHQRLDRLGFNSVRLGVRLAVDGDCLAAPVNRFYEQNLVVARDDPFRYVLGQFTEFCTSFSHLSHNFTFKLTGQYPRFLSQLVMLDLGKLRLF